LSSAAAPGSSSSNSDGVEEDENLTDFSHYEYDAAAADVWSLGVLLFVRSVAEAARFARPPDVALPSTSDARAPFPPGRRR
jgi:hypothetical protein